LEKKRLLEKTYKPPENLLDIILGRPNYLDRHKAWCADHSSFLIDLIFSPEYGPFIPELNRCLFKLQYKAIIKPDRLEVLPTQALEAKR
jgi:hypothetical protein